MAVKVRQHVHRLVRVLGAVQQQPRAERLGSRDQGPGTTSGSRTRIGTLRSGRLDNPASPS
jgi:hypothetical protein